jgi:hypothetical protein
MMMFRYTLLCLSLCLMSLLGAQAVVEPAVDLLVEASKPVVECDMCVATLEYTMRVLLTLAKTRVDYSQNQRVDIAHPQFHKQVCEGYPFSAFRPEYSEACLALLESSLPQLQEGFVGRMAMSEDLEAAFEGDEAKQALVRYSMDFCFEHGCARDSIGGFPMSDRDDCTLCKVVADDLRVRVGRYETKSELVIATELAETCKLLGIRHIKPSLLSDVCWEMSEEHVLSLEVMLAKFPLRDQDGFLAEVCGDRMMDYC